MVKGNAFLLLCLYTLSNSKMMEWVTESDITI